MQAPDVETVLVAVDGSDAAARAASFAVEIAERYRGELVILYVHEPDDFAAVRSGEADAEDLSATAQSFLGDMMEQATAADIPTRTAVSYGFSTHSKLVHPGSVILDSAEELDADFMVIPRETFGDSSSESILAKAAEYALLYASQPVLAV